MRTGSTTSSLLLVATFVLSPLAAVSGEATCRGPTFPLLHPLDLADALVACDDSSTREELADFAYYGATDEYAAWLDLVRASDVLLNGGGAVTDEFRQLVRDSAVRDPTRSMSRVLVALAPDHGLRRPVLRREARALQRPARPITSLGDITRRPAALLAALLTGNSAEEMWQRTAAAAEHAASSDSGGWRSARDIFRAIQGLAMANALADREARGRLDVYALRAGDRFILEDALTAALGDRIGRDIAAVLQHPWDWGARPPDMPGSCLVLAYRAGNHRLADLKVEISVDRRSFGWLDSGSYTWLYLPAGTTWEVKGGRPFHASGVLDVRCGEGDLQVARIVRFKDQYTAWIRLDDEESVEVVLDALSRWDPVVPPWVEPPWRAASMPLIQ